MTDMSEISTGGTGSQTFGQRLLPICYFSAITIAMAGWIWAIGWALFATANWLFA